MFKWAEIFILQQPYVTPFWSAQGYRMTRKCSWRALSVPHVTVWIQRRSLASQEEVAHPLQSEAPPLLLLMSPHTPKSGANCPKSPNPGPHIPDLPPLSTQMFHKTATFPELIESYRIMPRPHSAQIYSHEWINAWANGTHLRENSCAVVGVLLRPLEVCEMPS